MRNKYTDTFNNSNVLSSKMIKTISKYVKINDKKNTICVFNEIKIDTFISTFHGTSKLIIDFPIVNGQIKSVIY